MTASPSPSRLLSWLRLLRVSNLPTAIANILMAFILVHQSWLPIWELVFLVLASAAFYLGGMVLNDVFDFEIDKRERPQRPIPSNQIPRQLAMQVGYCLLGTGILLAVTAGWVADQRNLAQGAEVGFSRMLYAGSIAGFLAVFIYLYDGPLKKTFIAPFLMGGCRFWNILLGASTFVWVANVESAPGMTELAGVPTIALWAALAVGILISGTTLLGRKEASDDQSRFALMAAGIMIAVGLAAIAFLPYCPTLFEITPYQKQIFPLVIGVISLTILRRVVEAVFSARPKQIQRGVVAVLRSLIILDAAICYLAVPNQVVIPLVVLSLLIPTFLLARFVPST